MIVIKYIILALIVCLTIYLVIDTTVFIVKKVRQKRKEKANKDNKTE